MLFCLLILFLFFFVLLLLLLFNIIIFATLLTLICEISCDPRKYAQFRVVFVIVLSVICSSPLFLLASSSASVSELLLQALFILFIRVCILHVQFFDCVYM